MCARLLHAVCHVTPLGITNIVLGLVILLPWIPIVFLLSGSQKCEDKTMNRGNGRDAALSETCLTVIYRDTREVLQADAAGAALTLITTLSASQEKNQFIAMKLDFVC